MYNDYYGYGSGGMENFITALLVVIPIILILVLGIAFIFYIFEAIGLYNIAKQRGYKNAGLAFIPVVNSFVFGGIVDNINSCYGKRSNFRIWLLVLHIFSSGTVFFSITNMMRTVSQFTSDYLYELDPGYGFDAMFGSTMALSSLLSLVGIAFSIISYICMYKIYSDYAPNSATLYLVFSILFGIAPFFLFAIRNKPSASIYYANQVNNQQQPFNNQYGGQGGQPPYNTQFMQQQQYQQPQQPQYPQPQQPQYQQPQQPQYQQPQQPQYQQPQQPQSPQQPQYPPQQAQQQQNYVPPATPPAQQVPPVQNPIVTPNPSPEETNSPDDLK